MNMRKMDYPLQEKALNCFSVEGGKLVHRSYDRYDVRKNGIGNKMTYVIPTDKGKVFKTPDQLNKLLNGYYWSFDPDPGKAMGAMWERLESDSHDLWLKLEKTREAMQELKAAESAYFGIPEQNRME